MLKSSTHELLNQGSEAPFSSTTTFSGEVLNTDDTANGKSVNSATPIVFDDFLFDDFSLDDSSPKKRHLESETVDERPRKL
jgi:hypothetical protein